jgi:ABC-type branched-subunit amino acid transport system ATPase component
MVVILVMIGMLMVVQAARPVVVIAFFSGMAVRETMGMAVFVLVQMVVSGFVVPMGMGMQVAMEMVMFVLVLQGMDGTAAALPVGKGQAIEIAQALVLEKNAGGHVLKDTPFMHHQGPAGQFAHEEHIVADQ